MRAAVAPVLSNLAAAARAESGYHSPMAPRAEHCEWTSYYRIKEVTGVTALHARFVEHRYPRHSHPYSVVGLVESGVQAFSYRGSRYCTPAGRIFVVNFDEPHTGEPATSQGYVYRTLYLEPGFLARTLRELGGPPGSPYLRGAVLDDPQLLSALSRLHAALSRRATTLEQQSLLLGAVMLLLRHHTDARCAAPRADRQPGAVARARDYIEAHSDQDISLAHLAESVGLSPFHLARVFTKAAGMPPHAYLEGVRIRNACALLDLGEPIAAVAAAVGYADQSHLTRRFRHFLGITPRQYLGHRQPAS